MENTKQVSVRPPPARLAMASSQIHLVLGVCLASMDRERIFAHDVGALCGQPARCRPAGRLYVWSVGWSTTASCETTRRTHARTGNRLNAKEH